MSDPQGTDPSPVRAGRLRTSGRTRRTAMIVACAMFMQSLDSTVIATALPTMAKAFGADPVHMNVALTSYLLSLAVFIPASGWVADRYGARTVFRVAIAVFTLGSVLCGRADSLAFLVVSRVLQGIGGAMMVPVGRLVLLRTAAKQELVAAMAWLTVPALLGPVLGPPVGGFIVTYFSWRWIFDINVPIGILGIVLVSLFVEDVREPPRGRFDGIGLVLCGVALSGLMFGLETAGRGVVPRTTTAAMIAVGLIAIVGYLLHARRHPAPLLDLSLMRLPCFGVALSAMMLFRTGIGAIPFLLPLMFQVGFGDSAVESGLITFASSAGALVMKPATQTALRMFGFRDTLVWNGLLSAVMIALCAAFRPTWPAAAIYAALLIGGFFRSLQFTAYNTLAYGDVPRSRMSSATSLYVTCQQLAATIGISAGAVSLEISMALSGHTTPQPADFSHAFLVVAMFTLVAAPIALLMRRDAGDELTGRHSATTQPARGVAD
jgi:EmrB/QacA subfamily drug resistance transporter